MADGIGDPRRPDVGYQRVDTGTPSGLDPLVAVNKHPSGMLAGHHHNGQQLTVTDQRVGHLRRLARALDAGMGIDQIQMDELEGVYGDGPGHGRVVSDVSGKVSRVISLQDGRLATKSLEPTGIN